MFLRIAIWGVVISVLCVASQRLYAQKANQEDLKVGLVLSGGGAKGLAHIGALKVIEEAGVRIDYIGGTSMGAIVGALYASGYSASQMDSLFNTLDFETLIQDNIPRASKTFYEKEDGEKYAITLPFDGFKVSFPSGISKGQNVYNLFSRLTAHVNDITDFNQLPIPFFCVATNVETGEEVILNQGYLPRAVTASGALPSLFSPVTINDTIYIDGGVVNNYPVDEVRDMGADIVIGIDVQDTLRSRENLKSALEVLVQINNYRTINAMEDKIERTDVYINPNIDDYTVVSFDQGNEIINAGVKAADSLKSQLMAIARRQKTNTRPSVSLEKNDSLFLKEVRISGNENYTRAYILGKLKLRTPGFSSYQKVSEGVNNLSATGNFQDINYRLQEDPDNAGEYIADFHLGESDNHVLLRLGAHYDDLFKTAALINITGKRLFTNNDVASFDFIVGDNIRYNLDYYIDKGYYWSVGLSSRFNFFDKNVAIDFLDAEGVMVDEALINQVNLKYTDLTNQAFVQTVFARTFQLGMGVEHKWLRYLSETIGIDEDNNPRTIFEDTNYFSAFGSLKYDTLDDKFFPTNGVYFEGDFHWYLLAEGRNTEFEPFSIAKAQVSYAQSLGGGWSAVFQTEGGVKIGSTTTRSLDFFVGGYGFKPVNNIVPFYGFEALSLRGDTYLKSTLTLDFEFAKKNHLNLAANIANVGDDLFGTGQWIDGIDYTGYAVGYGLETFLGPMELKYSYSPERDISEWYVTAGFRF